MRERFLYAPEGVVNVLRQLSRPHAQQKRSCGPPRSPEAGTRNINLGVLMPRIADLRRSRALAPAVVIHVMMMIMSGVTVRPVLAQDGAVLAEVDRTMENYRLDAHIPGMVWGIVQDGRLVHVKGAGVQDIDTKRPVTADTLFRIASMTKAFTAL